MKCLVHSIWQVKRKHAYHKEHIIPKGIIEIIFNFNDSQPIEGQIGSINFNLPNCFINGYNKIPIGLQHPKQQVFFGVQLQPMAVKKIIGIPASKFSDLIVDLALLDSSYSTLWHQLVEQDNFETRVSIFSNWVESKLFNLQPQELHMNQFLCAVNQHDLSVSDLANSLCYSPRHLSRKILEVTGMNTEEILHYKKYLHAIHLIHHTDLILTKIAYQSHFSDQSHFIKAFKTYTHLTPGEYRRNKGDLMGHVIENVR